MSSQTVSQGTLYLTFANIIFLISGYIIHIGLGRLFGPVSYGIYALIISIATIFNLFLVIGIPQAVSKFIAEDRTHAREVLRSGLIISFLMGTIMSVGVLLFAPVFAALLHDNLLIPYIQLISILIFTSGPLMIIGGFYNGIQDYQTQSLINILYYILKPTLIFIFVFSGMAVWGALLGFVFSPIIPFGLGLLLVGIYPILSVRNFSFGKIIAFSLPIMILSAIINLILTLDLFFIKSILVDNQLAGYYSAASQIARIPYVIVWGISFAIFPAIAGSMANLEKVRKYISESLRYTLLLTIPFTVILAVTSTPLISLIYSPEYAPGGVPLEILFFGMGFFGLFFMLVMIISSCNRPYLAMGISFLVLVIDLAANSFLIPILGMSGGALATTSASAIGVILGMLYVYKQYGAFVEGMSLLKIIISTAIVALFVKFLDLQGFFLIIGYLIAVLVYFVILFLLHEIKSLDIDRFINLFR